MSAVTHNLGEEHRRATAALLMEVATLVSGRVYSPRIKLLTIQDVCAATSLGASTIDRMVDEGKFPRPQQNVGKRLWRESAIIAWCDANDPNQGQG